MGQKNEKIEAMVDRFRGQDLDPHYLAYFDCFNQQLFFEAHEVLEKLWLPARHESDGLFYQGLIQFAGAFVHVQKGRVQPAAALLRLARGNLIRYPRVHHYLDIARLIELIELWLSNVEKNAVATNAWSLRDAPQLVLVKKC